MSEIINYLSFSFSLSLAVARMTLKEKLQIFLDQTFTLNVLKKRNFSIGIWKLLIFHEIGESLIADVMRRKSVVLFNEHAGDLLLVVGSSCR